MEEKVIENTKKQKKTRKQKILFITQLAVLTAIEVLMCFTPMIGTIIIVPGSVEASISFIPAIVASVVLGPVTGTILGLIAGACSFIWWTFIQPSSASALLFTPFQQFNSEIFTSWWTIIICFVPRILMGLFPGLVYKYGAKIIKNHYIRSGIASVVGIMTNTLLVLFGTYFLWGKEYAQICGMTMSDLLKVIFTLICTNGLLEMLFCTIVTIPLSKALLVVTNKIK